jgi:tRNA pseudouridine55 synthase
VGISSNHALQAAKRLYRAEKAGHAGTLDPLASGLLPVLLGDATKFSGFLLDAAKGYDAGIRLGITTATADAEGEVLERKPVNVDREAALAALQRFVGVQTQVPPMYSALKREGTPLYVLARRGENVERVPRRIEIFALDLLDFSGETLTVRVACSKGTYVRTLAEDIGAALGCGAHLSSLRRTATGPFDLSRAVTLEVLQALDETQRDALLIPPDGVLGQLPKAELAEGTETRFCQGQSVAIQGLPAGTYRVYDRAGRFLGLGEAGAGGGLAPKRLLSERNEPSPTS